MSEKFKGGLAREIKVGYARILFGKVHIPVDAVVVGVRRVPYGDSMEEYVEYYEELQSLESTAKRDK